VAKMDTSFQHVAHGDSHDHSEGWFWRTPCRRPMADTFYGRTRDLPASHIDRPCRDDEKRALKCKTQRL
jgi:hypothetical protein